MDSIWQNSRPKARKKWDVFFSFPQNEKTLIVTQEKWLWCKKNLENPGFLHYLALHQEVDKSGGQFGRGPGTYSTVCAPLSWRTFYYTHKQIFLERSEHSTVVENAPFYRPSREIAFPELSWNLKGALEALEGAKRFAE